jgi:hypothetical protein
MKYRTSILLLCVVGVLLSWLLPTIVRAIHEAHGMATAHEFHSYHLIDQDRLEVVRHDFQMPNYSVEQRVRAVGGLHIYLPIVSVVLGLIFAIIGVLTWLSSSSDISQHDVERYPSQQ